MLTKVIWSSPADLSGSGPHKLIVVFIKYTEHSPVGSSVTHHVNNKSQRLAGRVSPFSSPCYVGSHCSAFLSSLLLVLSLEQQRIIWLIHADLSSSGPHAIALSL